MTGSYIGTRVWVAFRVDIIAEGITIVGTPDTVAPLTDIEPLDVLALTGALTRGPRRRQGPRHHRAARERPVDALQGPDRPGRHPNAMRRQSERCSASPPLRVVAEGSTAPDSFRRTRSPPLDARIRGRGAAHRRPPGAHIGRSASGGAAVPRSASRRHRLRDMESRPRRLGMIPVGEFESDGR
jgi:hypothetical protein